MVDFNINLLRCETCNFAQNFLCSLQSFPLIPTTDKLTRVHTNSATLIDNIFSSNVDEITLSGNIVFDISDNYSQFGISRSENAIDNHRKRTKLSRDFRNFSDIKLNDEIPQLCYFTHK